MKKEMNYLEEFLFSAQKRIDGLSVTTEPDNTDDYKYLIIGFDGYTYKIEQSIVTNYCNIYQKLNRDTMDAVEVEVDPYRNLGKAFRKDLVVDSSVISSEEQISELLEKIVSKIYDKYNFLILPMTDDEVEQIIPSDYVEGSFDEISSQEKSQGQNLYSIGFKIKAEAEQSAEYFPFKVYFRIFKKESGDIGIKIAEEFNSMAKSSKINVMTTRKFSNREKAELKKRFDNGEFEHDREIISTNIDAIINQLLAHIAEYVDDFEESPEWFKNSELGKYIRRVSIQSEVPLINTTASFRYITQTPLPYSYITIRLKNQFTAESFQIKKASESNRELNEMLNVCPICGESINSGNKLIVSNEYEKEFVGCQKCMVVKCSQCTNVWSKAKAPTAINKLVNGKFYHQAGSCSSLMEYCMAQECYGSELCSSHSKKCFDPTCSGVIYCDKVVERCTNMDCGKTFCLDHSDRNLYKCETSVCANSQFPNKYCSSCKDSYLNTCKYCGKTMCTSCSRPVMIQNSRGRFEISQTDSICLDCLNNMVSGKNKDINVENKALVRDENSGEFYPKSMEYLEKYGDYPNLFIDKTLAVHAYKQTKPEGWENDSELGKLWYKEDDTHKCDNCGELFFMTRPSAENKNSHYCDDCLVNCDMCGSLMVITGVIKYDAKCFCKKCFNDKWELSDLNFENMPHEKDKRDIAEEVFANSEIAKKYKLVPVAKEDIFICPDTEFHVAKEQTRECAICGETYASYNFEGNSTACKLCIELNKIDYNENRNLLVKAFYNRKYGDKSKFKAYCTKNTLLIKYALKDDYALEVFHYDKKSGKYRHSKSVNKNEKALNLNMDTNATEEKEVADNAE